MYSRVFSDFLNLDCSSRSSDDALDAEEEAEEENDDDEGGATDEAAVLEDEAGGMIDEKLQFQMILSFDDWPALHTASTSGIWHLTSSFGPITGLSW